MKKKYYILIGLITCMFMFFPASSVKAGTTLCHYVFENESVEIKYDTTTKKIAFYYHFINMGGFIARDGNFKYENEKLKMSDSAYNTLYNEGGCPERVFLVYSEIGSEPDEICFDDTLGQVIGESYCAGMRGLDLDYKLNLTYNTSIEEMYRISLNELDNYFKYLYVDDVGMLTDKGETFCRSSTSLNESEENKKNFYNGFLSQATADAYNDYIGDKYPNMISESLKKEMMEGFHSALENSSSLKNAMKYCNDAIEKDNIADYTEEEKKQITDSFTFENYYDKEYIEKELENIFPDVYIEKPNIYKGKYYCGIFGEGSFKIVKDIFGIVKILIPAIIILLGMADFLKVVFSGEEKDMKIAGMKLVKRLIIGIIFILLPVLLGFIFDIVGFSEDCLGQLI